MMMMMSSSSTQVVKVRRETLEACMTCPLCDKLLKEATTISECLHTFCRKCIHEKLTDEEGDCCPICYIDLGCVPVEKLRPDHNLQDVRAKIFPLKRRKIKAPEIVPTITLPVRRKERSLSSLVVSTPRVSTQAGSTGKRTKAIARKAAALRGSNFLVEEPIKSEDALEDHPESSSSPETLNKIVQNRRQTSSTAEPSKYTIMPDKVIENGAQPSWAGNVELWKPLTCLVEAANRTKSPKLNSEGYVPMLEPENGPYNEVHVPKTKIRDHVNKPKVLDDKIGIPPGNKELVQPRKLRRNRMSQKRAASRELGISPQSVLDAVGVRRDIRVGPVWFTLMASEDQGGDAPLPQISGCYLRIKDGNIPVSFIQRYIMKKLGLTSETEVEIRCRGHPVVPALKLHSLVDLWLQTGISQGVPLSGGTSAKDFIMVLAYSRKVHSA